MLTTHLGTRNGWGCAARPSGWRWWRTRTMFDMPTAKGASIMGGVTCATTIDWAATGTMVQGLGTVGGAITLLVAAIIGSNTFKSWKRQKLAERKAEQAERILTATYNVRRGLSRVRSPAMWANEFDAAEAKLKEDGQWDKVVGGDDERKRFAMTQAYYTRLHATHDHQRALEDCQPLARALFSEELEKAIEKLNRQFWTVKVYVDANHSDKSGANADFRRKIESTIWEGYPNAEENEVDQSIAAQVKLIEDICVPVLRLEVAGRTKN